MSVGCGSAEVGGVVGVAHVLVSVVEGFEGGDDLLEAVWTRRRLPTSRNWPLASARAMSLRL